MKRRLISKAKDNAEKSYSKKPSTISSHSFRPHALLPMAIMSSLKDKKPLKMLRTQKQFPHLRNNPVELIGRPENPY